MIARIHTCVVNQRKYCQGVNDRSVIARPVYTITRETRAYGARIPWLILYLLRDAHETETLGKLRSSRPPRRRKDDDGFSSKNGRTESQRIKLSRDGSAELLYLLMTVNRYVKLWCCFLSFCLPRALACTTLKKKNSYIKQILL